MANALTNTSQCCRPVVRTLMLRRRPVAILVAVLALWMVIYVVSVHRSTAVGSMPDPQGVALYQMNGAPKTNEQSNSLVQAQAEAAAHNISSSSQDYDLTAIEREEEEKEKEFRQRREHYEKMCRVGMKGPMGDVQYYQPASLALCLVPKVGSTFWLRVLHFLYGDTGGKVARSPLDVDRYHVHFTSAHKTKVTTYYRSKSLIDTFSKVVFVRDPWSRLWSSYVDKFVLPDSWLDHGVSILTRRTEQSGVSKGRKTKRCADDVTFAEFLDYALNSHRDAHWRPVSKVCNPCVFNPQYVGKLETFQADSRHILNKAGLHNLTEGWVDSVSNFTEDEIAQITDYHYRQYQERSPLHRCLSHSGLAQRLWDAFVLNGYIADNIPFPSSEFLMALDGPSTDTQEAGIKAKKLLLKYHRGSPAMTSQERREYRRSIMTHHYRKVPRDLLELVVEVFSADFALFDYDTRPADIFVPFEDALIKKTVAEAQGVV